MSRNKLIDLLVVVAMVGAAIPVILFLNVKPLVSTIFFFILPSVYLFLRNPRPIKRIFAASFLFGVVFAVPFDFLAILNGAWSEPVSQLVFPYKLFSVLPVDHLIWFFFWVFLVIVFYEHFVEHDRVDTISHNYAYGLLPGLAGGEHTGNICRESRCASIDVCVSRARRTNARTPYGSSY